jgi:hypothetical protein
MPVTLSEDQLRFLHLHAQSLVPHQVAEKSNVARVVKDVCGIQAQEASSAALAIRVRSTRLNAADVEQARVVDRTIIRTWGPRGTLHLLASEDIGWMLSLLGPVFVAGDHRRREELGLSEEVCIKGMRIMREVLADEGALTRAELVERLAARGVTLEGQARPHLLARAALEGLICLGPDRGTEPTYVLLSDWIGDEPTKDALSEDVAHAELTRRYLSAYGPATPEDQASWSGLSISKTRAAWQGITDELLEVETAKSPAWMLKTQAAWLEELMSSVTIVRLLPRYDTYLLGYQKRDLVVLSQFAKRVNAGGGIVHPTVMVDGRIVGTWKSKRVKNQMVVMVEPFEQVAPEVFRGIEAEIEDVGRFLGEAMRMEMFYTK